MSHSYDALMQGYTWATTPEDQDAILAGKAAAFIARALKDAPRDPGSTSESRVIAALMWIAPGLRETLSEVVGDDELARGYARAEREETGAATAELAAHRNAEAARPGQPGIPRQMPRGMVEVPHG